LWQLDFDDFVMSTVDCKVVLLGRSGVGKSCLVERYLFGQFQVQNVATVGSAYFSKKEIVDARIVQIGVWDTAGAERFESMTKIYYRGAAAACVCYDITDSESFGKANFWVNELLHNVQGCRIYLVGCKADLSEGKVNKRKVQIEDVRLLAERVGASGSIETSALSGANVDSLFQLIAADWLRDHPNHDSLDSAAKQNQALPASTTDECSC
jgi:Ras-related protein Rab-24